MATAAFDTLKAAKQLKQSGFSEEQAETLSEVFRQSQESHLETLATKADLADTRADLIDRIGKIEGRIGTVEGRLALLQWMVGFNLAIGLAVLWLLIRMTGTTG